MRTGARGVCTHFFYVVVGLRINSIDIKRELIKFNK